MESLFTYNQMFNLTILLHFILSYTIFLTSYSALPHFLTAFHCYTITSEPVFAPAFLLASVTFFITAFLHSLHMTSTLWFVDFSSLLTVTLVLFILSVL